MYRIIYLRNVLLTRILTKKISILLDHVLTGNFFHPKPQSPSNFKTLEIFGTSEITIQLNGKGDG